MNREVVRDIVQLQRTVSQINDEIPDAGITLRRTAAQAITTAGTTIVWQSQIRGQKITWSGSDITILTDGWYTMALSVTLSVNVNSLIASIRVNGTPVASVNFMGDIDRSVNTITYMRYFTKSDVLQIALFPSVNCNLNAVAEGSAGESPILHIVQLSNQAEV